MDDLITKLRGYALADDLHIEERTVLKDAAHALASAHEVEVQLAQLTAALTTEQGLFHYAERYAQAMAAVERAKSSYTSKARLRTAILKRDAAKKEIRTIIGTVHAAMQYHNAPKEGPDGQ